MKLSLLIKKFLISFCVTSRKYGHGVSKPLGSRIDHGRRYKKKGLNSPPVIFLKIHLSDFFNHSRIETEEDVTYVCSNGPENIDPYTDISYVSRHN